MVDVHADHSNSVSQAGTVTDTSDSISTAFAGSISTYNDECCATTTADTIDDSSAGIAAAENVADAGHAVPTQQQQHQQQFKLHAHEESHTYCSKPTVSVVPAAACEQQHKRDADRVAAPRSICADVQKRHTQQQ
jgi:hypothetical protein